MKRRHFHIPVFVLSLYVIIASGCSNYYLARNASAATNEDKVSLTNKMLSEKKYFILRNGVHAYHMSNIQMGGQDITCILDSIQPWHMSYVVDKKSKQKYMRMDKESSVLNEVHYFLKPGALTAHGPYSVDLQNIAAINVIDKDKVKTRNSKIKGGLITIGVVGLAVGLIGAAVVGSISVY